MFQTPPSSSPPRQVCYRYRWWGTILANAAVACKTLGLGSSGVAYVTSNASTLAPSVPIWMVGGLQPAGPWLPVALSGGVELDYEHARWPHENQAHLRKCNC